jgi:hypothetical protein
MATNLTGNTIAATYDQLLHVDDGPTATEKTVYSGTGVATALKVGTTSVSVDNIQLNGNTIQATTGNLTLGSAIAFGSASNARTALGLGTMATQNSGAVAITGGTVSGVAFSGSFTGMTLVESDTLATSAAAAGVNLNGNTLAADGTDTNIGINVTPKGTGAVTVTGSAIIAANSANAALRVTQVGTGNAILVEDSANPDATPFAVDASGNVGIGTTTPAAPLEVTGTAASMVVRATAAGQGSYVFAAASDYFTSFRSAALVQHNASAAGTSLGLSNAGLGALNFTNGTNAVIQTNGSNILRLGTFGVTAINIANNQVLSLGAAPGSESLRVTPVASAVNYLDVAGAATTGAPVLSAVGSDTNIGIALTPKGTGAVTTVSPVVIGNTAALTSVGGLNLSLQEHGLTSATSRIGLNNWGSGSSIQAGVVFAKSQSNVIGTQGIVSSGTQLGEIIFAGDDGAAFIPAASIRSLVNGTPGVNDMPGALVFSTTADGAAAVTERMRINAAGEALIGTASSPGVNLTIAKNITGAASATGVLSNGQLQVDVTSTAQYFNATSSQIVGGALSQLRLFAAGQGTLSGTVTNQYGFWASSGLIGATNNYGFYSDIASGANRFNFYAAGTAANVFVGTTSLGGLVGAEALRATPVASAVNYLNVIGAVTTASPAIQAAGSDTNIDITVTPKGTGEVILPKVNIDSGAIDGTTVGVTTPAAVKGTTVQATTSLGYPTGTGGTVTQATSRTTGVTLNKITGQITLFASSLGGHDADEFTLTNSTIAADDVIMLSIKSGVAAPTRKYYQFNVIAVAAGSCVISVGNLDNSAIPSAGTESPVVQFVVIKGAIA